MNKKEIEELERIYMYVSGVLKSLLITYEPTTWDYLAFLLRQHLDAYVELDSENKIIDISVGRYMFAIEIANSSMLDLSKCVEIYDETDGYIGFYDLENRTFEPVED